ncbi:hypothetical protein HOM50_01710 [bacterium]|nr:hypothetical protein [bacterium]MBT5015103.1 hypothetical protein [bacterium]
MRFFKNTSLLIFLLSSTSSNLHSLTPRQINQITFATAGVGMALVGFGALKCSASKAEGEGTDIQKEKKAGDVGAILLGGTLGVIFASVIVHGVLDKYFSPFGRYNRAVKAFVKYNQDPSILLAEAYQDDTNLMAAKINELSGGWKIGCEGPKVVKTEYFVDGFKTGEAYVNLEKQLRDNHPLLKAEGQLQKLDSTLQKAVGWCKKALAESDSDKRVDYESAQDLSIALGRSSHIVGKILNLLQATGRYMAQAKNMAEVGIGLKQSDSLEAFNFASITPGMKDFSQLWKN